MAHVRPGDRVALREAHLVGRVVKVRRDGLVIDWGHPLGFRQHQWTDMGARFRRLPRNTRRNE